MSDTTTRETFGIFAEIELGLLIGGIALAILMIIIIVTICVVFTSRTKKKRLHTKDDEEKMVNMQTARTVGGQPMQQVILKGQPNGNMERQSHSSGPLQTMDPETNTVRYDTAHSSIRRAEAAEPSKAQEPEPDVDSGTGDSPMRATAAVVHSDGDEKDEGDSQSSKRNSDSGANSNSPKQGADNAAYSSDEEEEIPFTTSYPTATRPRTPTPPPTPPPIPPPPPSTDPPPPTPGIPVTDLDEGETIIVPPPPPPPENPIYAEINKSRPSSSHNSNITRSTYRPAAEIEIIEKEKF